MDDIYVNVFVSNLPVENTWFLVTFHLLIGMYDSLSKSL